MNKEYKIHPRRKPSIYVSGEPLRNLKGSEIPFELQQAFEKEIWERGLVYLRLKYIKTETIVAALKTENPNAYFSCGSMGEADWEIGLAIVVESRDGIKADIETMLHEVRHFYDGPHPWLEEREENYK